MKRAIGTSSSEIRNAKIAPDTMPGRRYRGQRQDHEGKQRVDKTNNDPREIADQGVPVR
jgi:hypothetical protein